jgi:hypothetical protein
LNAAKLKIYQNGLTEGDKMYFDYHHDVTSTNSPPADSLKRKLDTPEGSAYKRRAV